MRVTRKWLFTAAIISGLGILLTACSKEGKITIRKGLRLDVWNSTFGDEQVITEGNWYDFIH